MDPTAILRRLDTDNPPTDDELSKAGVEIKEALDELTKPGAPRDKDSIALAKTLRESLNTLAAENTKRQEAADALEAELAELRKGVFEDEKSDDTKAEADEKPAEETKPEAEKPAEEKPADVKEPEPVSASALADLLGRQISSRTKNKPEEETRTVPGVTVRAIGPAAGYELPVTAGIRDLGKMFATHAKSVSERNRDIKLFTLNREFSEERTLGENTDTNNVRLAEAFGFGETSRPVTAAGGLCGPGDVDHSHPICAERGRPVRDSLVQFNATRGQVTYHPSAGLGAVQGAVSIWTAETDANPGTATKPCPPVDCPDELTASVDAVVRCLTIGNFQARFSPELWASRLELLLAMHDRVAEQKSIQEIHEAAIPVPAPVGSTKNIIESFLQNINSVIATDRAIQRKLTGTYVVLADSWVRDQIRNQVIENLGVANNIETIQIADSIIAGWLSDIGARAVWTYDGTVNDGTGEHNIPAQVGAVPAATTVYVYPEDAYFFLDGGTLDLGTSITDSSLNATNDRQAFAESFEKTAFRGCSSYRFELNTALSCGCA